MKQRILILSLVFISIVAACGGNTDTSPEETFATPPVPYMVLYHQEASVAGLQTNLCWPEGQGNVSCEPTFGDLQPNEALTVSKDDTINIGFGDAEAPDEVVVKSGSIELTFRANEQPQIPMNLFNDGRNTLEITAYYTDVAGSQAAVSSLFAVEVGTAVASNPTPASEDGAVETPVAEVTSEGVVDSTPDTSDTGTDETPAPEVTSEGIVDETPVAEATDEPAIDETPVAETTETAGGDETPVAGATDEPAIDETPVAETTETAGRDETPVAEATDEPAIDETPVAETTETVGGDETPVAEITEDASTALTATPEAPQATPTITPFVDSGEEQATPSATFFIPSPTIPAEVDSPSATPAIDFTITPTPQETVLNATDLPSFVGVAPDVTLRVGRRNYSFVGVDFCRRAGNDQQICIAQPAEASATRIRIGRNSAFIIRISDSRPSDVNYRVLNADTLETLTEESRLGDNNILASLDVSAGEYLLAVRVTWTDKSGTYYFRIRILE